MKCIVCRGQMTKTSENDSTAIWKCQGACGRTEIQDLHAMRKMFEDAIVIAKEDRCCRS